MSGVIDSLMTVIAAVDGVAEVLDNAIDQPQSYPAVILEIPAENTLEPEELPVAKLELAQKIQIGVGQAVGRNKGDARAARDTVLALSRKIRSALEQNRTINGACLQSLLGHTRLDYAEWHGSLHIVAWLDLAAQIEEEFS